MRVLTYKLLIKACMCLGACPMRVHRPLILRPIRKQQWFYFEMERAKINLPSRNLRFEYFTYLLLNGFSIKYWESALKPR